MNKSATCFDGWRKMKPYHCTIGYRVQFRVCNRLSGYSGYSDIRKYLSVRIAT